ncbi:MAG: hypothetical protein JRD89_00345 [Deltaproteobacteria bacterium]|nr:hypothetical protein [Deltaproteobacteria bacterium]
MAKKVCFPEYNDSILGWCGDWLQEITDNAKVDGIPLLWDTEAEDLAEMAVKSHLRTVFQQAARGCEVILRPLSVMLTIYINALPTAVARQRWYEYAVRELPQAGVELFDTINDFRHWIWRNPVDSPQTRDRLERALAQRRGWLDA